MELHAAEQLALKLMKQFGLIDENKLPLPTAGEDCTAYYTWYTRQWRFEWDNAKRRFGCCFKSRRIITLSRNLTSRNEQAEVEDCIRHEIAHALAPNRAGHNHEWKQMCALTGAKPERCYDSNEIEQEAGDWRATCGNCGRTYTRFKRLKSSRSLFCSSKTCKDQLGRRLHPLAKLVFRHRNEIADVGIETGKTPKQQYRAAVDAMKEQLKRQEEMQEMARKITELERKLGNDV